jgi:subtilisin family serine protease
MLLAAVAVIATAVLLATGGKGAGQAPLPAPSAASWRGLVGSRPRVALGERVIVVMKTPSLAERVAAAGGVVDTSQERAWTNNVVANEKLLLSRLSLQGVVAHPDFSYARVLSGFSTLVDSSAIPIIERDDNVQGVYPVRVAYPATISTRVLSRADYGPLSGHRPDIGMSGVDGRGVTIALLDTGVDSAVPYLRGRVQKGLDIVGGSPDSLAASNPTDPTQMERHGTQMAGLLVGAGGPGARRRRDGAPSCRSGSRAGNPTRSATTRSTRAATRSSPASIAQSTRTTTATRTTRRASRSSPSPSRSLRSPTGLKRWRRQVRSHSTRSSSHRWGTTAWRLPATVMSRRPVGRRLCSRSVRSTRARRPTVCASCCAPGSPRCSTAPRRSRERSGRPTGSISRSPCRAARSGAHGKPRRG